MRTRLMVHYRRIFAEKGVDYVATPTTGTTAPLIRCGPRPSSILTCCPQLESTPSTGSPHARRERLGSLQTPFRLGARG